MHARFFFGCLIYFIKSQQIWSPNATAPNSFHTLRSMKTDINQVENENERITHKCVCILTNNPGRKFHFISYENRTKIDWNCVERFNARQIIIVAIPCACFNINMMIRACVCVC